MFAVGTKVVCIDDIKPEVWENIKHFYNYWIEENRIYTIREIMPAKNGKTAFLLEGMHNNIIPGFEQEAGYDSERFREITEDEVKEIMSMLEEEMVVT